MKIPPLLTRLLPTSVFTLQTVEFTNSSEQILQGNRDLFRLLPSALSGNNETLIVGWGSQGPAQAQNLRDSLKFVSSNTNVRVALQPGSKSIIPAENCGFTRAAGTLGTIDDLVPKADLVILLIADGAQTKLWKHITGLMKPGATLGLSHGFLLGHLKSIGEKFRDDINVILMAPKGMGKSVRALYEQGKTTNGAGINSSVAVEQDVNGRSLNYALGWAVGTGSPATFFTTMEREVISDIFGERCGLLGALWGASEALYDDFISSSPTPSPRMAFLNSAQGLTSTVSDLISEKGLKGFYEGLSSEEKAAFARSYNRVYARAKKLMGKIYEEVASWREIADVVSATEALATTPMESIESSEMWTFGADLHETEVPMSLPLAYSAGVYIALMMAQMMLLREKGHCTSEIVNESLIEAIDSLNAFMRKRGVGYMVDNCSTTARLGTRKWGPKFKEMIAEAFKLKDGDFTSQVPNFLRSTIHADIATCYAFRPPVKLIVD